MAEQRHFQFMLFLADSASGNYLLAMNRQSRFRELDNIGVRQAKDRVTRELNIKFETEKKETELKIKDQNLLLLRQQSRIQEIRLHQTRLIRNITFAGLSFLFLILFLLYWQYRSKKKSNKIILEQNTMITKKNDQLSQLLSEKEMLLKEVHHRVKNNLQTMMSLLESQSAYLQNDALRAIEDSQHRVYAMSLIHQKLYQSADIGILNMDIYLREFIQYLSESFDVSNRIIFRFHIAPVELTVTYAIPLALIINEAVTNSIKYAFPERKNGEIFIALWQDGDDFGMEIADNGIGIPPEIQHGDRNSLGLDLIHGLTNEIKGQVCFDTTSGTKITVKFRCPLFEKKGIFQIT
jgi:two-component sensor histidine kinase